MDQADFYELVLKHLIRDPETLKKAQALGMEPEDMLSTAEAGIVMYKIFAEIALSVKEAPIAKELFLLHLKNKFDTNSSLDVFADSASELFEKVYAGDLNSKYLTDNLKDFVKRRRQQKAKLNHKNDIDSLREELNEIDKDLSSNELAQNIVIEHPFRKLLKRELTSLIPTGFARIDTLLGGGGVAKGEYGVIIGYTGSGKTASATNIARHNAIIGNKVAFVSMEETASDIANRFYSQVFQINYSQLRNGQAYLELEQMFNSEDNAHHKKLLETNLALFGLKGLSPITPAAILGILQQYAKEHNFVPDLVLIDQMQFLEPNEKKKNEAIWDIQARLSNDCDWLSHQKINGQFFGLWVLHQAKSGKLKKYFTTAEISGFKGILQPTDIAVGIGREGERSNEFGFFSLKTRHTGGFEVDYDGELQFMTFRDRSVGAFGNYDTTSNYASPTSNPTAEVADFKNPTL